MTLSVIFYPYHFVLPFCPYTILSVYHFVRIPFCPYHFVSYHFVLEPSGVPATSARLSRASFMSHLLAPPPCRAVPSLWLALWYGMASHLLSGHSLEYSPRNSFSNLKQHYLASLGLEALLSSPI